VLAACEILDKSIPSLYTGRVVETLPPRVDDYPSAPANGAVFDGER
jgi:hypothetical protein